MRNYELTTILDPTIAEEDIPQAIEKLGDLINKNGGEIIETNHWGRRRLSYPIGKHAEGNYVMMRLGLDPEKTAELETDLNIATQYLRHLLLRIGD
ncbi:MAG: 30S ribosomal protein S6 [Dehalococcoidia bacterium]